MKVCFFLENYRRGGLDTFLINLFNSWPSSSDDLTLMCNHTHIGLEEISNLTYRSINICKYKRVFTGKIFQRLNSSPSWLELIFYTLLKITYFVFKYPVIFPWYLATLSYFFYKSEFDRLMVVNGGYPASFLGRCAIISWRLSGKEKLAILNFHNLSEPSSKIWGLIDNNIDRLVIRSSKKIVSVSKDCLNSIKIRPAFKSSKKLLFIYNGIEDFPKNFSDQSSEYEKYCLMLATYEPRKGHTFLLNAFRIVTKDYPFLKLRIYGDGKIWEKRLVANKIKELGLDSSVIIGDFVPNKLNLIANASVLVVPSQDFESFGLTIIEAMSLCVPVVVTDVGGMPEIVGGSEAGYICSKSNPIEFAAAIKKIVGDPSLSERLGINGRKTYLEKFTAKAMSENYRKLLE